MLVSNGTSNQPAYCGIARASAGNGTWELQPFGETPAFSFTELDGERIQLSENGQLVFVYNFGEQLPRGAPRDRRRSSYIHPIFDLDGIALTDDFPTDHLHHRGLSWMWPRVSVGGQNHDLWHLRGLRQHFEAWTNREVGPVCATLGVHNSWRVEDRKVAEEWVQVRAFRSSQLGRVLDISLTWEALEEVELLGQVDNGYGGLCFRLAPRREAIISTEQGPSPEDSDLEPHAWADQTGRFGEGRKLSGVTIIQHPLNPSYPAGWCLRYYGFLGVSWPGLTPYRLEPGQPLTLRYRIWVHRGDVNTGRSAEAFRGYVEPPEIQLP